ncbi:MAG: S8/S53 family peptidase [Phycisphaerae bacterium]|nr:S8/S53 family peptidase [Saprospiraceae bacterium]
MPTTFDWSKAISELPGNPIPAEWLATKGKDVKVAFIDTGVNLGLASLQNSVATNRRFFTGAPTFSVGKLLANDLIQDSFPQTGHGTKYFSLLAGQQPTTDADSVLGLIPDATFYIIKTRDKNDVTTTVRNLLDAFELSANLGIDVAICGLCISASKIDEEPNVSQAEVDRVFNLPGVKKMHIFNALENRDTGNPWDDIAAQMFPNRRPEVFNVARLPNDIDKVVDVILPQQVSFLAARFEDWSVLTKGGAAEAMIDSDSPEAGTNLGAFKIFSSSSAVAIMGGIGTLAFSFLKGQNNGVSPSKAQLAELLNTRLSALESGMVAPAAPTFFTNINPSAL